MSDLATQERAEKRNWAEPGGRHDAVVKAAKYGLPVLIGLLLLFLAIAPFDRRGDTSFILDKNKVSEAPERMRVDSARYTGQDNKGQNFTIVANQAVQPTSTQPIVHISGMAAQLQLARGPVDIAAIRGIYDIDRQVVSIDGPIKVAGPDGYSLATRDVTVDLNQRAMQSSGPVSGTMELGEFSAGKLSADLDERIVRLDGGVRLKIRQGAVR
nr:LPS export ABC transporter periplasmic protein LptC [uncultured Sphingomonas sp.]